MKPLSIESLESRRHLNGDPLTVDEVRISRTDALIVFGDVGDNEIVVEDAIVNGEAVTRVSVDGRSADFAAGSYRRINIEAAGGDDVVRVDGELGVPVWVMAGNGDDVILGSTDGFNLLVGGRGNDTIFSRAATGRLVGSRGFDVVDRSSLSPRVTLQTVDRTATVDVGPYRFDVGRNLSGSRLSLGDLDLVPAVSLDGYALPTLTSRGVLALDRELDPRSVSLSRVRGFEFVDLQEDLVIGDGFAFGAGFGIGSTGGLSRLDVGRFERADFVRVDVLGRGSTFVLARDFRGFGFGLDARRNPGFAGTLAPVGFGPGERDRLLTGLGRRDLPTLGPVGLGNDLGVGVLDSFRIDTAHGGFFGAPGFFVTTPQIGTTQLPTIGRIG